jgi:hypothetical protein
MQHTLLNILRFLFEPYCQSKMLTLCLSDSQRGKTHKCTEIPARELHVNFYFKIQSATLISSAKARAQKLAVFEVLTNNSKIESRVIFVLIGDYNCNY